MPGNRRWTEAEDEAIREAAARSHSSGQWPGGRGRRGGRLRAVAESIGRSYGAVRNRAVRIGASSRPPVVARIEEDRAQVPESRR